MKKIFIAGMLLLAAYGSGSSRHQVIRPDKALQTSVQLLNSAADRLHRSTDSLGKALIRPTTKYYAK